METTPPEKTATRGENSEPSAPAWASPRYGPLPTTMRYRADTRPRISSVVTVCTMVKRHTALTLSAAPATTKRTSTPAKAGRVPARAMAPPQQSTVHTTTRPAHPLQPAAGRRGDQGTEGDR